VVRDSRCESAGRAPTLALHNDLLLLTVVVGSGFAGLGYELVWTRMLSFALGTEMMATLGVVGGFFGGLAIGAFALDPFLRRARSPALAYAALEAVIGVWGLISIWLLPNGARIASLLLGTDPSPIVLWSVAFALPALLLLPATASMGGTLAALERLSSTVIGRSGASAGIYGANTGGAVLGVFLSAFVFMPRVGLGATIAILVAVNGLCALGAFWLRRTAGAQRPTEKASADIRPARLTIALFATGLLGVSFEMLLVRLGAQMLQDTVYTFASLLAVYLLGAALGGLLWQRYGRTGDASFGWLLVAASSSALASVVVAPFVVGFVEHGADHGAADDFEVAAALFLFPSIAMGALFGHLAEQVRAVHGSLNRAVGVNSVGAALAPLVTTQLLIPQLGVWRAMILVAFAYLLLAPVRLRSLAPLAAPAAAALALAALPAQTFVRAPKGGAVLATREGPMATVSVVDDAAGVRYLDVNGHFRMGGTSSERSDYRQAALPLLLHPAPRHVLFLGVGTGATLVGGGRFPGVEARGVELLPEVVALLPWFADQALAPRPPAVSVADARRYIFASSESYDVIVADLFHPALEGSGALYTAEHFAAVRGRLASGGLFCQWLPLWQLDLPSLRAVIRSFLSVYPNGSAWLNHYSVRTPMLALIARSDGVFADADGLAERIGDPSVAALAGPLGFRAPIDALGQFVAGPAALARFVGDGPLNTDDRPFVTFDARANVQALSAPPWVTLLALTQGVPTDVDELLPPEGRVGLGAQLASYWRARNRFLELGAEVPGDLRGAALIGAAAPGLLEVLRLDPTFDPAYAPLMSMARGLLASNPEAGARLLRDIDAAAPQRGDASDLLARQSFRQE